jgi:hypothetical protein
MGIHNRGKNQCFAFLLMHGKHIILDTNKLCAVKNSMMIEPVLL